MRKAWPGINTKTPNRVLISHVVHDKNVDGVNVKIIQQHLRKIIRVSKPNESKYCYIGHSTQQTDDFWSIYHHVKKQLVKKGILK